MKYESFIEKQQMPVNPGPLDAEFHIIQLGFGGDNGMSPAKLIAASQELDLQNSAAKKVGIYTDIPPQMSETIEESEHAIEVAVRRSFDFMKCPVILGGNSLILPAVERGLNGQLDSFTILSAERVLEISDGKVVIALDGDSLPDSDFSNLVETLSFECVGAIVVTGSGNVDYDEVVTKLMQLLDAIAA